MPQGKPRNSQKERFWRQVIKRWLQSGLTVATFCSQNHLSEASFYAWRRTLAARDRQSMPFAQVRVVADESANTELPAGCGALELVLANRRVLRIGQGFDAVTLRRLLPLLEEDAPC